MAKERLTSPNEFSESISAIAFVVFGIGEEERMTTEDAEDGQEKRLFSSTFPASGSV